MREKDLIAALGTALGEAAISMIRLSGEGAVELVASIFKPRNKDLDLLKVASHTVTLGYICDDQGDIIDEVLVCVMRAPRTYTREDVVEIFCHGGILPVRSVMDLVLQKGARIAEPGEFTKCAFLNGRIDLAQAEAVLDLIRARSSKGAELACNQLTGKISAGIGKLREELKRVLAQIEAEIDFPEDVDPLPKEERLRRIAVLQERVDLLLKGATLGRIYREGLQTVLVGKPNVGKSTLLNMLLGEERALVTDIPGTTRDLIEEMLVLEGIPLRIVDTAGIRESMGLVESLGIERAKDALEQADLVLALFDVTTGITDDDLVVLHLLHGKKGVVLLNKADLPQKQIDPQTMMEHVGDQFPVIEISSKLGWGQKELADAILNVIGAGHIAGETVLLTRKRHQVALEKVKDRLVSAQIAINGNLPLEFIAVDIWDAWSALGEIIGETLPDEIISSIFSEFCVGK
ncbi:tRNA uridine-5-carboxymethylaminomethyl(34) synthesis GTPase MnmE [Syntrophaceticus schinkii]|jgi:tRNA modification GTPase|uniref:tRNA modification GTPase MnmE n=1 Tax=Syntrophaceticus schinkii TaxID=499207 RepID=A0A0B7MH10_9FIRM|nr:tRNA uridine-5-carboxymethylaminomethyl(34) synthesis GTPase MnmE [Syntrophaceticus schinkii]CEO87523.1 tRNA modification GTPase MnmE [Syntrophaceticus schinkii]